MPVPIEVPDNLPGDRLQQEIREMEEELKKEAEKKKIEKVEIDLEWMEFLENIDEYAIETGIEDLAENHDHYLYGTPKRT